MGNKNCTSVHSRQHGILHFLRLFCCMLLGTYAPSLPPGFNYFPMDLRKQFQKNLLHFLTFLFANSFSLLSSFFCMKVFHIFTWIKLNSKETHHTFVLLYLDTKTRC